jgi:hypothetical protein
VQTPPPRIGLKRAGEQPHERRLPGAVAAEQPDPLPGFDVAGHVVEQRRAPKSERQVAKGDERHPLIPAIGSRRGRPS